MVVGLEKIPQERTRGRGQEEEAKEKATHSEGLYWYVNGGIEAEVERKAG